MPVQPNIQFTILVKIDGRLHEFNFRKRSEELYDVDTNEDNGNRLQFKWKATDGNWDMKPSSGNLPDWVIRNEGVFREKFKEYVQ